MIEQDFKLRCVHKAWSLLLLYTASKWLCLLCSDPRMPWSITAGMDLIVSEVEQKAWSCCPTELAFTRACVSQPRKSMTDPPKHVMTQHSASLFLNHVVVQFEGNLRLVVRWEGDFAPRMQGPRGTVALLYHQYIASKFVTVVSIAFSQEQSWLRGVYLGDFYGPSLGRSMHALHSHFIG